jgi:ubiquinone biosynthesis protein
MLFNIGRIGRTYRHMQRYRQIVTVLIKYGFGDLIDILNIEQYLEIGLKIISRKRRGKMASLSRAERVRMVLEELGPTFIKMGQILSTRPDLLPVEYIKELPKLQDDVPPFPFSDVKKIIEKEFKKPVNAFFSEFDEQPVAAASIGQVHKAVTQDGERVVIKIQRPGIKRIIEVDLEIMLHLSGLMERHLEGWDIQHPTKIVREFAATLEKELDYSLEAAYMERFAMQFKGDARIHVPKTYKNLTTKRVLTMEYIDGIKSSDLDGLERNGLDRIKIARIGFDLIMQQIFVNGFFHADPHPGNIFVLPDNMICFIDFGMMGRINLRTREHFADLILSIVNQNEIKTVNAILNLTEYDDSPDYRSLERDVVEFIDKYCYRPLKEVELGALLRRMLEVAAGHRLNIPPDLFLMIKALSTIEGLGVKLDPDFDVVKQAAPFMRRLQFNRFNPGRIARNMADSGTELYHLLQEIPGEIRDILKMIKRGTIKMEFEHRGLKPMLVTHDRISNRLAFAIVLAALIIGSALIVLSDIPPKWHEIPVIGLIGFVLAGVMGFWLLVLILRSGRM